MYCSEELIRIEWGRTVLVGHDCRQFVLGGICLSSQTIFDICSRLRVEQGNVGNLGFLFCFFPSTGTRVTTLRDRLIKKN